MGVASDGPGIKTWCIMEIVADHGRPTFLRFPDNAAIESVERNPHYFDSVRG